MRFFFIVILLFCFLGVTAQDRDTNEVEIINANTIYHSSDLPSGVNILLGEVELYHDSATMYCDSAILIQSLKKFNAFGNVKIIKLKNEDTIKLYGDTLYYDGRRRLAKVRKNVILSKDTTTLYTDSLDFDLNTDIGHYFNWGLTINGKDSLISKFGYFYAHNDELFFKDSVKVINPRFVINTDSLKHNLASKISYFFGPTEILSDTNYLYAEFGQYDHLENKASVSHKAYFHSGEHELFADSIFYDRNSGVGKGFNNVKIKDTVRDIILLGNYGEFDEKSQKSMMTDSALFLQIYEEDTLWLHSDTMFSYIDTLYEDIDTSVFRIVFAYYHVKIFRNDLQVSCDSMVYTFRDSLLMLFGSPIIWSDSSQINSRYTELYMYNNEPDQVYFYDSVFFAQQVDSINFNQVKCSYSEGWFKDGQLKKLLTLSKIDVIYFITGEDKSLIAVATLQTDTMFVYFNDNKVETVVPLGKTSGKLYPPPKATPDIRKIKGFRWYYDLRPLKPDDIFIWKRNSDIPEN